MTMLLFLLGYIVCFSEMSNLSNSFANAEILQNIIKPPTKVIKIRGTSFLKTLRTNNRWDTWVIKKNVKFDYLWENGIGCPTGTVPIKRITKKKLLRLNSWVFINSLNSFSDKYKPQGSGNFTNNQYNIKDDNHHFAVSRTNRGKGKIYNGATMTSNIYNPKRKLRIMPHTL
ncbi:unnamed protein product [Arabidopsis halleri]